MSDSVFTETKSTLTFYSANAFINALGQFIELQICNNTRNAFPVHYRFLNQPDTIQTKTLMIALLHHNVVPNDNPDEKWCTLEPKPSSDPTAAGEEAYAICRIYQIVYDKMLEFTKSLYPESEISFPKINKIYHPYRGNTQKLLQNQNVSGCFTLRIGNGWIIPDKVESKTGFYMSYGAYKFTKKSDKPTARPNLKRNRITPTPVIDLTNDVTVPTVAVTSETPLSPTSVNVLDH